jgi:hypothetical protein
MKQLILFFIAVSVPSWVFAAHRDLSFPTAEYLAKTLNIVPGAQLPRQIEWKGTVYNAYVVRGGALGNGEYQIVIRLAAK